MLESSGVMNNLNLSCHWLCGSHPCHVTGCAGHTLVMSLAVRVTPLSCHWLCGSHPCHVTGCAGHTLVMSLAVRVAPLSCHWLCGSHHCHVTGCVGHTVSHFPSGSSLTTNTSCIVTGHHSQSKVDQLFKNVVNEQVSVQCS